MRNNCAYCSSYLVDPDPSKKVCDECEKQVKKLDQETVNWLLMIIDSRIEKELDSHTNRYSHEPSSYGYF